jgi:vanadium chloroperoxidase
MRDYVMLWNSVALELNRRDHSGKLNAKNNRGPTASSRALAIVHLAMHDAFFGLTGRPALNTPIAGLQGPIGAYQNVAPLNPPAWSAANEGAAASDAPPRVG